MNYTPQRPDGSIDISKALQVNVEFDLSRQLWSYLIDKGAIADPRAFIHPVPHMSFVHGAENVAFLRQAVRGDVGPSLLRGHGAYRGSEADCRMGAAGDGRPERRRTGCRNAHHHRHRRRLRLVDASAGWSSRQPARLRGPLQELRHRSCPGAGRPVARRKCGTPRAARPARSAQSSSSSAPAAVRCRCWRNPASRRARLWRLSRQRNLAALRRSGDQQASPCQGLRQGRGRLAADVRAASRYRA